MGEVLAGRPRRRRGRARPRGALAWADDPDNEDGCHNRDEAVAFIERSLADGITSKLLDIRDAGDRLVAVIEAHTPPEWEQPPDLHGEVISIRDGKVTEMVVYGTVEDALSAVGLPAST